ncbi:MAG: 50S ribosomal protein L25/general stress protein Ctc [Oceanococcaceae bacterium]
MQEDFIVNAQAREAQGKGASRRLRRTGQVPAIIYGGHEEPLNIQVERFELDKHLEHESFYSHILTIKLPSGEQKAVLKDVQRHPAKPLILHVDFQRVVAGESIKMHVPLHFINEGSSAAKKAGGVIEHLANEVEIVCLPSQLPEYIEVDCGGLDIDDSVHMSQLTLPEGVVLTALQHGDDQAVCVAHKTRVAVEADDAAAEGEDAEGGDEA